MRAAAAHSAYRREGDETLVEIRLHDVRQLFHTLDPAPFREKDLDEDAERYLLEACREIHRRQPLRVIVHLPPDQAATPDGRSLPAAVHHYFDYRQRQMGSDIAQLLRLGAVSLAIGLAFLVACLGLRGALLAAARGVDPSLISEGLLILGWVAMWRPVEILLYEWWPLARRRTLLRRLAGVPIEVRACTPATA